MSAPLGAGGPAPDLIDPIVGFRQWRLVDDTLTSMFSPTRWPHVQLNAVCNNGAHDPGAIPAHECTCGIYAYYDQCPRTASAVTRDLIAGAVILWGSVELHGTGMRAEHARVVGLELPLSLGAKRRSVIDVAERLGVPAVAHRRLRKVALEHGRPVQRSLRPPRVRGAVNLWRSSASW